MTKLHILDVRDRRWTLCKRPHQPWTWLTTAPNVEDDKRVCRRCMSAKRKRDFAAEDAAAEARMLERFAAAADTLGARHVWDMVVDAPTPSERMVRYILGSTFLGLVENGHRAAEDKAVA